MASISFTKEVSQTGSGETSWTFTNSDWSEQLKTLAYANITKCTLSVQGKGSIASVSNHKMYVYIGSIEMGSNTDVDTSYESITSNNLISNGTSSYINVSGSSAGSFKNSLKIVANRGTLRTSSVKITITWEYTHPTYTLTLNANGGTVSPTSITRTAGQTVGTLPTPTREGYTFNYWANANGRIYSTTIVTGNSTVYAQWTPLTYTATFKNQDGTVLQTVTVNHGSTPSYTGSTPSKSSTAQYDYSFSGWSPSLEAMTSDKEYIAQFSSTVRKYTVTWKNYEGTVLETDTTEYGRVPTYDGATPVREADTENSYTFAGWHITVSEVKGDIEYIATYTATPLGYTVIWKNWDGTVLETDEKVPHGSMPSYDGSIPTREPTAKYTYLFADWDSEVVEVTKNVTYTAVFNTIINEYTITTRDSEKGTTSGGGTYEYDTSIVLTAIPNEGCEFIRWSDGDTNISRTIVVTGNTVYSAVFRVNDVYIGTQRPRAIYTDGKTVEFVLSEEIPQNMTEVDELYIGTTKIYEKI